MADKVLDLDTALERPKISIDGELYEILSPDELCVADYHRLQASGRKIEALMNKETLSDEDEAKISGLVREVSDKVMVGVPPEIREKLSDSQRMSVSEVFTTLPELQAMKKLVASLADAAAKMETTGEKSSQPSSGSTAATPNGGSSPSPSSL